MLSIIPVNNSHIELLKELVNSVLFPIYGDNVKKIYGWFYSKGYKKPYVSIENNEVTGFLCLKIKPDLEYVKISTLLVIKHYQSSGVGKNLLKFAISQTLKEGKSKIKVTVSEEKPETIKYFQKHGFIIMFSLQDQYKKGVKEFHLYKECNTKEVRP